MSKRDAPTPERARLSLSTFSIIRMKFRNTRQGESDGQFVQGGPVDDDQREAFHFLSISSLKHGALRILS